jgi:HPt (histidine-containing phosphotransfer) domain-containing protein
LVPLCGLLRAELGSRAVGLLLRHPPLLELPPARLEAALAALRQAGAQQRQLAGLLWERPDVCARLAHALHRGLQTGGAAEQQTVWAKWKAQRRQNKQQQGAQLPLGLESQREGGGGAWEALRRALAGLFAGGGQPSEEALDELKAALAALEQRDTSGAPIKE